jgi:acyl-CoA thioesterase YciA
MSDNQEIPHRELAIRTLAMPKDTNPSGDIFGGWVLSQMDIAGALIAKKITKGRVVTIALNSMEFLLPVFVGDTLCCYVEHIKTGRTSMSLKVEAWATRQYTGETIKVTEGTFTFVAVTNDRLPRIIEKD